MYSVTLDGETIELTLIESPISGDLGSAVALEGAAFRCRQQL
jgi:hypothetical protein